VNVSSRSTLFPGVALAAVGAVAAGSIFVAPPAMTLPLAEVHVPTVHIEDIQLAGLGQDVYAGINRWVVFGVQAVQGLLWWVPIIGAPIYSQIGVIYFDGIQPLVEVTVDGLASVVQNPLNLIGEITAYVGALSSTIYKFISAELSWLGLPGLPPQLPFASVGGSSRPVAAARARVAEAVAAPPVTADATAAVAVEVPISARMDRGGLRRSAGAAGLHQTGDAAASAPTPTSPAPTSQAPTSQAPTSQAPTSQAPTSPAPVSQSAVSEVRGPARASRGKTAKAVAPARTAAKAVAKAAN
jgi:hypothetical protein